jgi:hypothetical protein
MTSFLSPRPYRSKVALAREMAPGALRVLSGTGSRHRALGAHQGAVP